MFVSKTGLSLYSASNRPGTLGGLDIYVSQRATTADPWGPAQNLGPTINSASADHCAYITPDGHILFFVSNRPGGMGAGDIYVSFRQNKLDDFGWGPATNLGPAVNTSFDEFGPSGFEKEGTDILTLFFTSNRPDGVGGYDIYTTTTAADGTLLPAALVPELSSAGDDQFPTVSRKDGLELYQSSNRSGGFGGFDLWVSRRSNTDAPWAAPENLGATINTTATEQRPSLSWDGTTLFFASNRVDPNDLNLYDTTRGPTVTFDTATILAGGSFTAMFTGANIGSTTYFDVRFRRPGSQVDEIAANWQQGTSARHTVPSSTEKGTWIVTGVRAHQDIADRSGTFARVSASVNVQ